VTYLTLAGPANIGQIGRAWVSLGEPYLIVAASRRGPLPMYVCVCHAVTEDVVREHMAAGACSPKDVRRACGMRPGCGSCVKRISALLAETVEDRLDEVALEGAA
jgi:bacterioferritin-associated ferredoxin